MDKEFVKATPVQGGMRVSTAKLIDALKIGKEGDVLTDEELTTLCGRNTAVGQDGYDNLASAIRHTLNNYQLTWRRVRSSGCVKCLGPSEKLALMEQKRHHINRQAKTVIKVAKTVQVGDLPADERASFLIQTAQLQAVYLFAKTTTTKKLLAAGNIHEPDPQRLLDVFRKKTG